MPGSHTSDRKRKRSRSAGPSSPAPRLLPLDAINPLSHPPGTLRQFAVAGLGSDEPLPSRLVRDFPHRPLPRAPDDDDGDDDDDSSGSDDDDDDDESGRLDRRDRRARGLERERRLHEREVGAVVAVMRRALAAGDTRRARAAFACLLRATVHGKRVDLRRDGYWAAGAEVLMREAEGEAEGEAEAGREPRRWGRAGNVARVRAFFEDLIQLHPYDRHHPGSVSALDFWPAMLSCEVYDVYIEHKLALERLEAGMGLDGDGMVVGEGRDDVPWDDSLREEKNKLRVRALEGMRGIATRMDSVMENLPYSTSLEMLRLRGMAALYMGDLALPPRPRTSQEESEGRSMRWEEQVRAETMFRRFLERGGHVEEWFRHIIQPGGSADGGAEDMDESNMRGGPGEYEGEGDGTGALPLYPSLPMRPM